MSAFYESNTSQSNIIIALQALQYQHAMPEEFLKKRSVKSWNTDDETSFTIHFIRWEGKNTAISMGTPVLSGLCIRA